MYPGALTWTATKALGNLPASSGMDSVKMRKTPGKENWKENCGPGTGLLGPGTGLLVCVYL